MKKGFTLIEMLVGISMFILVVIAASGILVLSLQAQRKVLSQRTVLDEASYVMEYISRSIRMAKKELSAPDCLSANGLNYEKTRGGRGIKFTNYDNLCQEFYWDNLSLRLKEVKNGKENFLTSDNLEIISFSIKLAGESQDDDDQPRATLFFDIKGKGEKPEQKPEIKIQTTISQRNLDASE